MLYFCWTDSSRLTPHISLPHLGPGLPRPIVRGSFCCQGPQGPSGVTDLLPFCFRHPELVVAQEEGPHSLADLRLDTPIVDETQQLLLLVTLWEGERKGFGQQKSTSGLCDPAVPLLGPALKDHGANEQSHLYPGIHCGIKTAKPWEPPRCPPGGGGNSAPLHGNTAQRVKRAGSASLGTCTKRYSMSVVKWRKQNKTKQTAEHVW